VQLVANELPNVANREIIMENDEIPTLARNEVMSSYMWCTKSKSQNSTNVGQ